MTRSLSTRWIGIASSVTMAFFVFAVPTTATAQSCVGTTGPCFQGLGFLNPSNPFSASMAISPDGSVVVGFSTDANGNYQAFKWSGGTMTGLGYINPSCPSTSFTCNSVATGVNSLGTIVGYSPVAAGNNEAFSWSGGMMTGLGYLYPSFPSSAANAIASQANVAVGDSAPNPNSLPNPTAFEAVSFQNATVTGLGFLETTSLAYSIANGANANGTVIVGNSTYNTSGTQPQEAFVWQSGVMTGLGFVPSGTASRAFAANASGSVIVGDSSTSSTDMAVRWVNGTISALTGGVGGGGPAYSVSANGNVVVGLGLNGGVAGGPFRWTPVDGMQKIQSLLTAAGVNITGWSLGYVQTPVATSLPAVSANGTTITGFGIDPNGHSQAWIARLPAPGAPQVASHDFNADGKSDIVWKNGSGDIAFWLMNGAAVSSTGSVNGVPSTWSIVGQRDFNGDGKADLLWLDTSGNIAMWFMNGAAVGSTAVVAQIPNTWSVAGVADFNGDGLGDILWRNTTGDYAVWLMNGATVTSSAGLGNVPLATWSVAGTGDFNGDGKADILWRDTSGNVTIWFMNGTTVASTAAVGTVAGWSIVGTGDFNGDGKTDIVWRDAAGDAAIWLMNGAAVSSAGGLGNIPTTWSIVQTGDYNGDGMSDLLWYMNGNTAIWFMNGVALSSTGTVGNIPTVWTVQGTNVD